MKKILVILSVFATFRSFANVGDTTWIQANIVKMDYYNNFDTIVQFPDGSKTYRKILMYFTLGEYNCPSGSTYCHQWDYTVVNSILTKTDTVELGRFITPFANTGVPRFPSTWKQNYIFDVTNYYPLLKDSAKVRILYSGYSGGFTANLRFAFIEGTPERNVIGYSQLYSGSYSYGIPTDPIGFHLLTKSFTAPAGTKTAELKYTVTGHGSDNTTQCCEFAAHSYTVNLNGAAIASQRVWRNDCGWNELYPQGGTWIYNRSNWCPGATVNKYTHKLNGITALSNFSLRTVYDNYTTSGNYGNYFIEGHVVYFGAINHYLDVSMEDVIAPTNYEGYFRENPSGMNPVVKIHNAGSAIINTIDFSYGVKDSVLNYYTWNGTLAALTDTLITLPPLAALKNLSVSNSGGLHLFTANVLAVNGFTDEDTTNNSMSKLFYAAPKWPNKFLVTLNTNSQGVNSVGVNPSQTSYTISDSAGNVLFSRTNLNVNSTYADTVTLPANAFYKLSISDLGCDGLHWWVWDQNPGSGVTAGSFTVKNISNNALIAMNGYNYTGTFNNDFGCGFVQYFTTANASTSSVQEANMNWNNRVKIFPNPANNLTRIVIDGYKGNQKGELEVLNAQGQTMLRKTMDGIAMDMNTEGLADGIYTVVCRKGNNLMFTGKLVVAR